MSCRTGYAQRPFLGTWPVALRVCRALGGRRAANVQQCGPKRGARTVADSVSVALRFNLALSAERTESNGGTSAVWGPPVSSVDSAGQNVASATDRGASISDACLPLSMHRVQYSFHEPLSLHHVADGVSHSRTIHPFHTRKESRMFRINEVLKCQL
jgi:hypothetical protein